MTNTETFLLISLVLNVGLVVHAAMLISMYLGERRNAQMWRNAYTDDVIVHAEIAGAARALGIDSPAGPIVAEPKPGSKWDDGRDT